jgi:copper chaperone CopZ
MISKSGYAKIVALAGAGLLCPDCLQPAAADAPAAPQLADAAVAADTATAKLAIKGMTCGSCATTARIALERTEGVYRAEVSYDSASAVVQYDPKKTAPARLIANLKEMTGYEATLVPDRPGSKAAGL